MTDLSEEIRALQLDSSGNLLCWISIFLLLCSVCTFNELYKVFCAVEDSGAIDVEEIKLEEADVAVKMDEGRLS